MPLVPSITGSGAITSWTLNNTNLPTGISFGSSNGTLYGTAAQLWTTTAYKVWANNSGGSVVAYFNLTVIDQVPSGITYSPENVTLTNNTASSDLPLAPTIIGSGAITSWTLNNTNLPTGISFGSSNGTLYGTATQLWTRTSYKVWANNSGGSVEVFFNLTVNDQVPSGITYTPENVTLTNNTASSDLPLVPSITGSGTITSWELNNTSLPNGISFGSSNGTLYGTATELWTRTAYKVWANNSGGSVEVFFNLTVIDQVPSGISYTPENVTLTNDTASSDLPLVPSITGSGSITSWELNNTSLPSGISFGSSNGTLYGTATQLWTRTSYKVWANNTGGSVVAYFNLTVNDQVPTLSYSPENLTLTKGQASSDLPLNATLTGSGAITSWAISPTLPSGLNFGTSNGTIWGTPTTIRSLRTYTIWANNSGGSSSATVNITVNDELPNISYSPDWFVLTNNTAMSPTATPTNTGGAIPSTTIDSNGNAGVYNSIALDSNGYRHVTYSSQPTGSARTLMYATDASGTWVSITLDSTGSVGTSPRIVIDSDDNIHITYFRADSGNKGIKYATCSSSCSSVSSWTNSKIISFTTTSTTQYLTLSIDSNDDLHLIYFEGPHSSGNLKYATCSSSCATGSSWTNITIDGTSQAGYGGIDLVIDSSDHLHVAYSIYSTRDLQYITCSSSCTSVSSWTNLSIDSSGQVGRMPSIAVDSNDDLHISYYDDTGSGLKYAWCSSSCTTASSWSNTSIANGSSYGIISHQVGFNSDLAFDSDGHMHITHIDWYYSQLLYSTCSSSCSTNSSWSHSVLVSNPDVIHEQHLVIDSNDELNIVFYDDDDDDLEFMLLDSSSQPYEYSISPDLPTGLSINPTTGTISGTPTELSTNTTYTITVRNSGGVNTTTITIEVIDNVPTVSYTPENLTLTNNTASPNLPLVPTITGSGAITSWALNNTSLPSGISFSTNNGTFSGTPTELWPTQAYMVWANNTGGSVVAYLNITVNDQIPTLSYTPNTLVLTINNQSSDLPLNATLTGSGEITSWAINATLPAGLNFGTSNGTIWGIPTVLQTTAVTYTIWANNTGGSSATTVTITINDEAPGDIAYDPENYTLTNNSNVNISPNFVNITATGNNTVWSAITTKTSSTYGLGKQIQVVIGDVIYYDNYKDYSYGIELYAYNITNDTEWLVLDLNTGTGSSILGAHWEYPSFAIGDTIYFPASNGTGNLYWAYNTTNDTAWAILDEQGSTMPIPTGTGEREVILTDDAFYWVAYNGSANARFGYSTVNHTGWQLPFGNLLSGSYEVIDNVVYTNHRFANGTYAIFGYNSSNQSAWIVDYHSLLSWSDNSTLFYHYTGGSTTDIRAYNTQNKTIWTVQSNSPTSTSLLPVVNGVVIYKVINSSSSSNPTGAQLRAYSIHNGTSWLLAQDVLFGTINSELWDEYAQIGTQYFFSADRADIGFELWVYDSSNHSAWLVSDINPGSNRSLPRFLGVLGDTLYMSADHDDYGQELWAYDSSNKSTWLVADIFSNTGPHTGGNPGQGYTTSASGGTLYFVHNDTLYFRSKTMVTIPGYGSSMVNGILSYRPAVVDQGTNTGGDVVTWAINASLPSGLTFSTTNGSIYGTPTEMWNQTAYMVWANNSGGSSVAYLNITVVDELPTLSYTPNTLVLTINNQSSDLPLNATLTGSGEITSWAINATLPAGLNFGTSNGTIWGTPTVLQTTAVTYTIWANNTGGSSATTVTITINDEAPGPIEYIPENNTWTNNSYVNIGPSFVNQTSGNGSTWSLSLPQTDYAIVVGDVVYLNGRTIPFRGDEFYALNTSNGTAWAPNPTWNTPDNGSTYATFNHGKYMSYLIGDIIYFDADCAGHCNHSGVELWAYNTSNNSGWLVKDLNTNNVTNIQGDSSYPGERFSTLIGDTIYFSAYSGNASLGIELWAHDTSNGTTWRVGHTNTTGLPSTSSSYAGHDLGVIDDTFYFQAWGSGGNGLWAYNTSNTTMWRIDISSGVTSSNPGKCMALVVGDTLYFDADGGYTGRELWAHNHVNQTSWLAKDFRTTNYNSQLRDGNPGCSQTTRSTAVLYEDTIYLAAHDQNLGIQLFAYDTSNHSGWLLPEINSLYSNYPGERLMTVIGDTIYFDAPNNGTSYGNRQLWAHDTSNMTTWMVHDFSLSGGQGISKQLMVVGDTIYFRACGYSNCYPLGLWAHDTSNQSTWLVENGSSGDGTSFFVDGTLYTHTGNCNTYSPGCTQGYNLLSINYQTNTGGNVTSWAINGTLPSGVSFGTTNGTLYGTPTELWPQTSYMVWANNSGGSSVAYINITVVDELPTLSYSPSTLVLTINNQSSDLPLNATLTGLGEITSWAINATLPAGLNFGTSNGTIWGIPTVLQTTAVTYTIWANNTGGSSAATVTITINDEAPGPIEYIPENNTWTNNSYVNIGPSFINQTSGNGSTWAVSLPNSNFAMVVGDVVYQNGNNWFGSTTLVALNTSNGTAWYPNPTWYLENGSVIANTYNHGRYMSYLIGDIIYFDASGEFWAYNTSNNSGWLVKEINTNADSNPGSLFSTLMGDTIYFSASSGNASLGVELWAHNTSNGTTWRVGHTNTTGTLPSTSVLTSYGRDLGVIDDTIYFQAWGSGDEGLWAYNTSNTTMWEVDFRSTSRSANPGFCMAVVVGDTLYFDADGSTHGRELWAHNHANQTTWMVKDFRTTNYNSQIRDGNPGCNGMSGVVVGDTFYFSATVSNSDGSGELWAHNTSNHSTWLVADIFHGSPESLPGDRLAVVIGDTIYFDANDGGSSTQSVRDLWAHDTSNKSTWEVYDFSLSDDYIHSDALLLSIGDTLYFVASVNKTTGAYVAFGLWAHDTSNQSTWVVEDGSSGYSPYWPGSGQSFFVNGTLYTHISTCVQNCDGLGGYNLLSINYQTNTGGNVTSWAINGSLPSGVTFNTQTGVLSGTPTELWPQTSYMVWANNSGGSSVAYINITVIDELPTLSYTPNTLVLTKGNQSSDLPLNATLTGPGEITSWEINATLPAGLNFGTSNGTIWGVPTVLQTTATTYTIWANNSGGSTSATVTITIYDEAPGPFEYIPENNTWTNNSYVNIGPSFINITTGNNSNWLGAQVRSGNINIGEHVEFVVGDVIYFDEKYGGGYLYAYNTSNNTAWRVFETVESQTVFDVGEDMSMIAGDIIYFSGKISVGGGTASTRLHLYAHNTSNETTWRVLITSSYSLGVGLGTDGVVHGDDIYFTANTGGGNLQLWGYNSMNNTAWQATSTSHGFGCCYNLQIVGDNIYYTANRELWAYNTSNQSDWEVAEIGSHSSGASDPGQHMSLLVGDTIYFDADDGTTGRELWAYNTSNETYWRVADINNGSGGSNPGYNMEILVGDTIYFDANDGNTGWELWAHNTSNGTTWQAVDIKTGVDSSFPGYGEGIVVIGDTIYFGAAATNSSVTYYRELWAHDTSNHSTWQVSYLRGSSTGSNSIGSYVFLALGDTLYFSYTHSNVFTLWAYDTSNQSMWNTSIRPSDHLSVVVGNTIYLEGSIPLTGVGGLIAHQPGSVNYQTNTGGAVVSWAINGTLPSGVTFNNQTGVLSGTPTELWPQTSYMVWANNSGGTSVGYLNITVVDELPTLSYFPENLTLLNNTQSPSLPLAPTLNGSGIILEWGISPDLPSGLSFGSDNGTIWGVPTERMNTTMFTIWANNSGGSITANINITVLHQYPAFNYSVLDLMLVNNTAMTNVTSTVTGGEIVSWEVSPAMPVGILLDENGNISGLPTEVQNRTMYMVWANNTAGSHIVYINITIYDIIATLEYVPENITLTRNVTMTDLIPTHTGIIDSWEIWPALPDGLNFTNGTISGTPEYNMTRTNYTVYANNTGGSISHMINITIVEPVMDFEYIPYNVTLVNNTASSEMPMIPVLYNDGVAETWEIWPALPSGLNFSSTNGTISGIATELQVIPVNYTIWANNSGGVGYAIISITVIDQLPNLTYPGDLVLMNNTNSSSLPMLPVLEGPGEIVTWEISHELPAGLNFSSENGTISGIATELMVKTQYTVWANNSGGSSMAMFNVTVVDQVPDAIGYNHLNMVLTKNENNSDFLPLTPNLVGAGNITSWEINGTLPAGLNFSTENGTIWGIPTELYHEWQYLTIYANNSGGTVISNISIMVNDQIPTIAYNLSQIVLKNDTEMISIEAIHGGGPFVTVAIHPELPAGMYFGYGNATIWGHPTELTSKIEYTIWANNSGGSASTTINITVEDKIPTFEYTSTEFAFYVDTEMDDFPLTIISTGGEIQNFSISPQLPAGLFFGELNGTIWGVATEDISETTFTITAYNPLGEYSIDVEIAVYDYLYNFELDPVWISNDSYMPKITPTYIIPGATYSIGPALPEGMSVNPYTGVVSGRPNGTMQMTSFTLIASVDGYTLSVPMKLGVLEDTDKDGLPDEIPAGGNALNLVEDPDDDNDNVEDQVETDCGSDPLDADDYPEFNSNGNCAPEPEGIGFLWCLPIILLLLLVLVAIIALWKKKDDVEVVNDESEKGEDEDSKEDDESENDSK